jgi:parallel beta-helix repeat protein
MSKARVNILGALALVTGIPFAAQAFDEFDASQPATVAGQVYHVATTGSDANSGTLSQPFRTLAKAAAVVAAGDVVNVHGGVYALTSTLVINKHGSASARIVFQPYLNQAVTIDCASAPANTNCVTLSGRYIDFQGFEVRNARRTGISTWGGRHIRVRNNHIHHAQRSGIVVGHDAIDDSHVLVEGNAIYLNVQLHNPPTNPNGWPAAVAVFQARHVTLTHNLIYENFGEGIAFTMSDRGLIRQNEVRDNFSVNIYLDNATNTTVERNLAYSLYRAQFFRFNAPANGIAMANEGIYDGSNPLNNNRIVNNIVLNARRGINYGAYELGGGLKNTVIAYNTVFSATQATIKIDADAGHINTLIVNNIFYQTGGRPIIMHTASPGITFRHNLWYGGSAGPGAGPGDVNVNPLLANPGGLSAVDYRLLPGSPAINAADASYPIGLDYFGLSRPVGSSYDIGAHEFRWLAYVPTAQQP